ncbi:MAG: patatin-like phospholipase family protein [Acidimicrobiia bacterium]
MSSVGIVLGGGGVTGASYEMAALMALELATGWDPNQAHVIVGTSGGAYVAALVRSGRLDLDSMVQRHEDREAVAERISGHIFARDRRVRLGRWVKHGLLPGLRNPGLTMLLGGPAAWTTDGLAAWVRDQCGPIADSWPTAPTIITAFDMAAKRRVAFGTEAAPDVALAEAVAASSAIPVLFQPRNVADRLYVDGGVVSGTHADLVLGSPRPLDLLIVIAPMAADEERDGAWFYEKVFDRVGRTALGSELTRIHEEWPETDVVVLRPSPAVLAVMRPNPLDPDAAVPTFIRALMAMRRKLADPDVWSVLDHHLVGTRRRSASRAR